MNLTKLFEMQKALDGRIVKDKGLEGQDLLPQKILALQVELGELANEWRGFKFWSKDQQSRTERRAYADERKLSYTVVGNPLLEEYVDCLHFILSIGLHHKYENFIVMDGLPYKKDIVTVFKSLIRTHWEYRLDYEFRVAAFIHLGGLLGFTWEQIERAYIDKNAINHDRQRSGY